MVKKHVNVTFRHIKQAEFGPFARRIVNLMTENVAVFATPVPSLASVSKAIDDYEVVLNMADYPGKTGDLKNARAKLEELLKQLGKYVNNIANGDLAILEKSGFEISKDPSKYGPLPALSYADFTNGGSEGCIDFDLETMDGCVGYIVASTLASNPEKDPRYWRNDWTSKHIGELTGFERGKEYKFAVVAVGASSVLHWYIVGRTLFVN